MAFRRGVFGMGLGPEDRAFMNGISALQKRPPNPPLLLPLCEDTVRRCQAGSQQKQNLPALRSFISQVPEKWESISVVYKTLSLGRFCYSIKQTKTFGKPLRSSWHPKKGQTNVELVVALTHGSSFSRLLCCFDIHTSFFFFFLVFPYIWQKIFQAHLVISMPQPWNQTFNNDFSCFSGDYKTKPASRLSNSQSQEIQVCL